MSLKDTLLSKIPRAGNFFNSPIMQPNPTLQVSLFQQNIAPMPIPKFLMQHNNIAINNGVDTSYKAETGKGANYVPETKDYYMGEGQVDDNVL